LKMIARFALWSSVALVGFAPAVVVSQRPARPPVAEGRRVFNQSCSACHDATGATAKSGPSLNGYYRRRPLPTDSSVRAIIYGGKGRMPAFSTLDDTQMDELLAYLKTL
jgi:mono/diheme cytochrome c family protein